MKIQANKYEDTSEKAFAEDCEDYHSFPRNKPELHTHVSYEMICNAREKKIVPKKLKNEKSKKNWAVLKKMNCYN